MHIRLRSQGPALPTLDVISIATKVRTCNLNLSSPITSLPRTLLTELCLTGMIERQTHSILRAASPQLGSFLSSVLSTVCSFLPLHTLSPGANSSPSKFSYPSFRCCTTLFLYFYHIKKSHTISIITNLKITLKLLLEIDFI